MTTINEQKKNVLYQQKRANKKKTHTHQIRREMLKRDLPTLSYKCHKQISESKIMTVKNTNLSIEV